MEIGTYIRILWRRKWIVLLTALFTIGAVYIGLGRITPTYSTTAKLRVATARSGAQDFLQYDIFYADRLMNTYAQVAQTGPVIEQMMTRMGLTEIPSIEVNVLPNTEVLEVTVSHTNPEIASGAANTLAQVLIEDFNDLVSATLAPGEDNETESTTPVQVTTVSIIEEAWTPTEPSSPNRTMYLMLGAVVGVVGGMAVGFLFESLDTRLRDEDAISAAADRPILGRIPVAVRRTRMQFLAAIFPHSESFRHLRTQLFAIDNERPLNSILITSAQPNEGKSTILANVAFTFAQTGKRTLVIDADMRLPTQHHLFEVDNGIGLSHLLGEESLDAADVIQHSIFPNVDIIPSGPIPTNPSELLSSPRMVELLAQMNEEYAYILIDAPAFLPVTDAGILSQIVDSVVLVVSRAQTTGQAIKMTVAQLENFHARLIGLIINRTSPVAIDTRYYGFGGRFPFRNPFRRRPRPERFKPDEADPMDAKTQPGERLKKKEPANRKRTKKMSVTTGVQDDTARYTDPNPLPAGVVFDYADSGAHASGGTEHSRLVDGLLSVGASMFLRLFLGFTSLIIAARILTPDEFGVYFLMMTLVYLLEVLGDFGLRMSVSRFVASADTDDERRAIVDTVFGFRLLSLIPFALLALLLKPLLMLLFPSDLLSSLFYFVPIMFLVDQMEGTCADIMQGYHLYRKTAIVRALTGALNFGLVLLFLPVMDLGTEGLVLAYVFSVSSAVLMRLFMIPGPIGVTFDWPRTKEILKFGVQLQGNDILTFLFGRIDVLMLGALLGARQIAFLEVGARIPEYFQQLYQAVNAVYLPHMSGLFSHKKEDEATTVLNSFLRLAAFGMLGCTLALILFGREVVLIVFDETYLPSVPVLGVMMGVVTISLLSTIMDIALVSAGKPIYLLFINGVMMVATLIADVTLIPAFGLMGVVAARLVANLIANPVSFYYVRRIGLQVDIIAVLRPVVIFGAILAGYFLLDVDNFLLKATLLGVYPVLCFAVSAITADEILYFVRTFQRRRAQTKLAVEL